MAVLAPPFILCPYTESKELLGFSKDQTENKIIFTLGKNIAIRYSVKDQKQEKSWTLKVYWFTSKVVFCPDIEKYAAVINNDTVCVWKEEDTDLAHSKKYKFLKPVFEIIPTTTFGTLVVFQNGVVARLSEVACRSPKYVVKDGLIDENTTDILDVHIDEDKNLLFIVSALKGPEKPRTKIGVEKKKAITIHIVNVPNAVTVAAGTPLLVNEVYISLEEVGKEIIGWCILSQIEIEPSILYLLSDGTFLQQKLMPKQKQGTQGHHHIDKTVTEISRFHKYVNTENPVVLRPCAESTVVVYGCSPSEEGAVVLIYDLKYDLVLSHQSLKLYCSPPIMTKIDHNIFIPSSLNILVVAIRLTKSLLSSVVGQHRIEGIDFVEVRDPWKTGWEQEVQILPCEKQVVDEDLDVTSYEGIDLKDLEDIVKTLEKNGHPESLICAQVIPQALEKCKHWRDALSWVLEYFEDIPEDLLVTMLLAILSSRKSSLGTTKDSTKSQVDVDEQSVSDSLISEILKRTFDRNQMVKNLRVMDYDLAKILLEYISEIMDTPFLSLDKNGKISDESSRIVCNVMKWAGALLDAHYTHFVFNNETILIDKLLKLLEEKTTIMKEIEKIEPLVKIIRSKTKYDPKPNPNSIYRVVDVVFR